MKTSKPIAPKRPTAPPSPEAAFFKVVLDGGTYMEAATAAGLTAKKSGKKGK